jgi:hypothetical protein
MRKLILKDLLLDWRMLLGTLAVYSAWAVYLQWGRELDTVRPVLAWAMFAFIPFMLIAREDRWRALSVTCSLPVSRRTVVAARYALIWMFVLLGLALTLAVQLLRHGGQAMWADGRGLQIVVLGGAVIALFVAFLFPLIVRFGYFGLMAFLVGVQLLGIMLFLAAKATGGLPALRSAGKSVATWVGSALQGGGAHAADVVLVALAIVLQIGSYWLTQALFARRDV